MAMKPLRLCLIAALAVLSFALTLLLATSLAAQEQGQSESCPLQTARHTATLLTPKLEGKAGEDVFVEMAIEPAPGNDFYVSTLARVAEKPQDATTEILPGFPKLRFRADQPGSYELELRITLVSKSSCGGVKARELADERVVILLRQPSGS